MNKFFQNAKRGFTLVELLIVIIIISVLAGVVLIAINPAEQRARASATTLKSNTAAVCRAQALCMVEAAVPGDCAAFGAGAVEIADPSDSPTGSTYTFGAATPFAVTGVWLSGGVGSTQFSMACNNIDPATIGRVVCTESGAATYTCAGFGL